MNSSNILIWTFLLLLPNIFCAEEDAHLQKLFNAVQNALYSRSPTNNLYYRPEYNYVSSNGISLGIYKALSSITKNDDLECVFRLLCEAAAGGRPGYSGRDINFDKTSLTKFVSYLNLGSKTSPFLAFAKAALLGVSNRGDPYSCIINYSKCPRDQNRLLHYLNNHRGGFFQYFDGRGYNDYPTNYNYNYYYNNNNNIDNGYRSDDRPIKYKKKQIVFENSNFYSNMKKKAKFGNGVYAQKYAYSSFKFPTNGERDGRGESSQQKPVVFPQGKHVKRYGKETKFPGNPRILNRTQRQRQKFHKGFENPVKFPKNGQNDFLLFPDKFENGDENKIQKGSGLSSDRLPPHFHFPVLDEDVDKNTKLSDFKENSFFPE